MKKVLVVEDSEFQRRSIRKHVEAVGFEIVEAENGKEALELVASEKPELILSDISMPEMDGMEFINELRNTLKLQTPFIFFTSDQQESTKKQCIDAGACEVIVKPLDAEKAKKFLTKFVD